MKSIYFNNVIYREYEVFIIFLINIMVCIKGAMHYSIKYVYIYTGNYLVIFLLISFMCINMKSNIKYSKRRNNIMYKIHIFQNQFV